MKRRSVLCVLFLLPFLFLSCEDEGGSDDDSRVTLADEIQDMAEEYDSYPEDAKELSTRVTVGDEEVDGTVATDVGTTQDETVDVSVTIPDSLASRARYSDITIEIWLNGEIIPVGHDGTSKVVTKTITLAVGNNVMCVQLTKDGVQYRSAVIHIYYIMVDSSLVGRWIRTGSDYDTEGEDEGFEITAGGDLYDLEKESGEWTRTEQLAENLVATGGAMTSYDPVHPAADLYESTYSLSENNTHIEITEGSNTIYGVKMEE